MRQHAGDDLRPRRSATCQPFKRLRWQLRGTRLDQPGAVPSEWKHALGKTSQALGRQSPVRGEGVRKLVFRNTSSSWRAAWQR